MFHQGGCHIKKPDVLLSSLDPEGSFDLETVADELSNKPRPSVDLMIYQLIRIHGITPFGSVVIAS